jgi:transitional endoplasmic reticulum ATPase
MDQVNYKFENLFSLHGTCEYVRKTYANPETKNYTRIACLFSSVTFVVKGAEYSLKTLVCIPCAIIKIPFSMAYAIELIRNEENMSEWTGSLLERIHTEFPGFSQVGLNAQKVGLCASYIFLVPIVGFFSPSVMLNLDFELAGPPRQAPPIKVKEEPKKIVTFNGIDFRGIRSEIKQVLSDEVIYPLQNPEIAGQYKIEMKHIILHGPKGSGREYIASVVKNFIAKNAKSNVSYVHIDLNRDKGKKYKDKLGSINELISKGFFPVVFIDGLKNSETFQNFLEYTKNFNNDALFILGTEDPAELDQAECAKFGNIMYVHRPTFSKRYALLEKFLEKYSTIIAEDIDLNVLATKTKGFSIDDLKTLVDKAARCAYDSIDKTIHNPKPKKINQKRLLIAAKKIIPSFSRDIEAAYQKENSDFFKNELQVKLKNEEIKDDLDSLKGMDEVKEMITKHVLKPLQNPIKAKQFGIQIENIVLHGLPGCGKTHLVSALTNSIKKILGKDKVVYMEIDSSTNGGIHVHEPVLKIKEMFDGIEANIKKGLFPVVFIDEIECVLKSRESAHSAEYYGEEIELYLKGIERLSGKALFVGATNKPTSLDPALIRTGRLGHKIFIGPPDREQRKDIIQYYLDKYSKDVIGKDLDVETLANATEGFSASDLKSLVMKAAMIVFTEDAPVIDHEKVIIGLKMIVPSCPAPKVQAYRNENPLFF